MKNSENENDIYINYSYENNDSCDGLLRYNKINDNITIEKLSDGADLSATKWLFPHIYSLLDKNNLTESKKRISIG